MLERYKSQLLMMVQETAAHGLEEWEVGLSLQFTDVCIAARKQGLSDEDLVQIVQQGMQPA